MRRWAWAALAAWMWGISSQATTAQAPRFRSTAEAVQVDVQVKDGSRPVGGLTAADFELTDSGVRQQIQAVTFADVPLSVLLALDVSTSVRGQRLEHLKGAALSAVGALRAGDQAALLTFSQKIALRADWTENRDDVSQAIHAIDGSGATSLHDAVFATIALREYARGRALIVVFTDGRDTASWLDGHDVVTAALKSDVVVYAVSAGASLPAPGTEANVLGGRSVDARFDEDPRLYPYAFLGRLTKQTGGELIRVDATRDLPGVFAGIVNAFKSRYLLTYAPKGVSRTGWHPIEVKLTGRRTGTVTARRGYMR